MSLLTGLGGRDTESMKKNKVPGERRSRRRTSPDFSDISSCRANSKDEISDTSDAFSNSSGVRSLSAVKEKSVKTEGEDNLEVHVDPSDKDSSTVPNKVTYTIEKVTEIEAVAIMPSNTDYDRYNDATDRNSDINEAWGQLICAEGLRNDEIVSQEIEPNGDGFKHTVKAETHPTADAKTTLGDDLTEAMSNKKQPVEKVDTLDYSLDYPDTLAEVPLPGETVEDDCEGSPQGTRQADTASILKGHELTAPSEDSASEYGSAGSSSSDESYASTTSQPISKDPASGVPESSSTMTSEVQSNVTSYQDNDPEHEKTTRNNNSDTEIVKTVPLEILQDCEKDSGQPELADTQGYSPDLTQGVGNNASKAEAKPETTSSSDSTALSLPVFEELANDNTSHPSACDKDFECSQSTCCAPNGVAVDVGKPCADVGEHGETSHVKKEYETAKHQCSKNCSQSHSVVRDTTLKTPAPPEWTNSNSESKICCDSLESHKTANEVSNLDVQSADSQIAPDDYGALSSKVDCNCSETVEEFNHMLLGKSEGSDSETHLCKLQPTEDSHLGMHTDLNLDISQYATAVYTNMTKETNERKSDLRMIEAHLNDNQNQITNNEPMTEQISFIDRQAYDESEMANSNAVLGEGIRNANVNGHLEEKVNLGDANIQNMEANANEQRGTAYQEQHNMNIAHNDCCDISGNADMILDCDTKGQTLKKADGMTALHQHKVALGDSGNGPMVSVMESGMCKPCDDVQTLQMPQSLADMCRAVMHTKYVSESKQMDSTVLDETSPLILSTAEAHTKSSNRSGETDIFTDCKANHYMPSYDVNSKEINLHSTDVKNHKLGSTPVIQGDFYGVGSAHISMGDHNAKNSSEQSVTGSTLKEQSAIEVSTPALNSDRGQHSEANGHTSEQNQHSIPAIHKDQHDIKVNLCDNITGNVGDLTHPANMAVQTEDSTNPVYSAGRPQLINDGTEILNKDTEIMASIDICLDQNLNIKKMDSNNPTDIINENTEVANSSTGMTQLETEGYRNPTFLHDKSSEQMEKEYSAEISNCNICDMSENVEKPARDYNDTTQTIITEITNLPDQLLDKHPVVSFGTESLGSEDNNTNTQFSDSDVTEMPAVETEQSENVPTTEQSETVSKTEQSETLSTTEQSKIVLTTVHSETMTSTEQSETVPRTEESKMVPRNGEMGLCADCSETQEENILNSQHCGTEGAGDHMGVPVRNTCTTHNVDHVSTSTEDQTVLTHADHEVELRGFIKAPVTPASELLRFTEDVEGRKMHETKCEDGVRFSTVNGTTGATEGSNVHSTGMQPDTQMETLNRNCTCLEPQVSILAPEGPGYTHTGLDRQCKCPLDVSNQDSTEVSSTENTNKDYLCNHSKISNSDTMQAHTSIAEVNCSLGSLQAEIDDNDHVQKSMDYVGNADMEIHNQREHVGEISDNGGDSQMIISECNSEGIFTPTGGTNGQLTDDNQLVSANSQLEQITVSHAVNRYSCDTEKQSSHCPDNALSHTQQNRTLQDRNFNFLKLDIVDRPQKLSGFPKLRGTHCDRNSSVTSKAILPYTRGAIVPYEQGSFLGKFKMSILKGQLPELDFREKGRNKLCIPDKVLEESSEEEDDEPTSEVKLKDPKQSTESIVSIESTESIESYEADSEVDFEVRARLLAQINPLLLGPGFVASRGYLVNSDESASSGTDDGSQTGSRPSSRKGSAIFTPQSLTPHNDLDHVKGLTQKLRLNTKRPSYVAWKEQILDKPYLWRHRIAHEVVNKNIEDDWSAERMGRITEALGWLRNQLVSFLCCLVWYLSVVLCSYLLWHCTAT